MTYFGIKESEKSIPYYACFPKLAKEYLKESVSLLSMAFVCISSYSLFTTDSASSLGIK